MFVILTYDVSQKRTNKVLKKCRQYLIHVQNSVFEGEIGQANFNKLIKELGNIIDSKEDSILTYQFENKRYYNKQILGKEKNSVDFIF